MKNRRNISDAAESAGERDLQEKIDAFCLMDDKFMRKCLEKSRACVQYIARALLDDDSLVVREFSTQRTVANLQGRSATLDRLVHDLRCSNPDEMHSKTLANQVRRFKTTKEGRKAMSEVLEKMCAEERMAGKREGKREGKKEGLLAAAKRIVQSGLATLDQVVTTLKLDKAQERALRAML